MSELTVLCQFGFMRLANPEFSATRMYKAWSEEKGLQWARAAPSQSALSFASPQTFAGYKDIAACYVFCEDDGIIPLEKQEEFCENIKKATGKEVETYRINTGHVPNLTETELVSDVIVGIASAS